MKTGKLRWGILGTAKINAKVLPHFADSAQNALGAIASRDFAKARTEADHYGIPKAYGSYAELLADPAIDVLYVSLPNHLHAEWTEAALSAGKHVLCEKPFTLNARAAERLVALAREKGLRLAEGFMYRHHAQTARILEIVRGGGLGEIRRIHGSFHTIPAPGPNIRTDGRYGGGAVGDVGCYLVNFANAIAGKAPIGISARGRIRGSRPEENYDTLFSALLDYGNGVTAQLDGGFLGPRLDELRILGEKGWLDIPHPFKPAARETFTLFRRPDYKLPPEAETIPIADERDPFATELEAFAGLIRENRAFPIAEWENVAGATVLAKIVAEISKSG